MHALTTLVAASLPALVLAGGLHPALNGRASGFSRPSKVSHRAIHAKRNQTYTITDLYQGDSFFNDWTFYSETDPTGGMVNYVDVNTAKSRGLTYVESGGATVFAVDSTNDITEGSYRDSVRITSNKTYSGGLFIADFQAMPTGCSTWPAWWSVGPNWPAAGEMDIIEGVNGVGTNQMTLHSNSGCTLDSSLSPAQFSGDISGTQCASSDGDDSGCAILDPSNQSFAAGFNQANGGVFAHLWNSDGVSIWRFARDEIPSDITAKTPNPGSWGKPIAFWSSNTCDMSSHFYQHSLVLDVTLCGDWAGASYSASSCPGTCAQAVANASNFANAKWVVNYIAVYNGISG